MNKLRILLPAAAVVAASVGGAAWLLLSADKASAVTVTPPKVTGDVASICRTLYAHLPATVDGQSRDTTSPASDLTAAWGASSSPIVMTCGAAKPAVLVPGTAGYDPSTDAAFINGVAWLPVQQSDGYAFYTTERAVYVEVFVPSSYDSASGIAGTEAPTDLTAAVIAGTPTENGGSGPDPNPNG